MDVKRVDVKRDDKACEDVKKVGMVAVPVVDAACVICASVRLLVWTTITPPSIVGTKVSPAALVVVSPRPVTIDVGDIEALICPGTRESEGVKGGKVSTMM